MNDLKKTTRLAVVSSFVLVGVLLQFGTQSKAVADRLLMFGIVLVGALVTIVAWTQCAKKYIDDAIDRKLSTSGREKQQS